MEYVDHFRGNAIGFDTSLFIYYIEEHPKFIKFLSSLFESNAQGHFKIIMSPISLMEVLIHPYRKKQFNLAKKYEEIFTGSSNIEIINIDPALAKITAEIRAEYNVRLPDAIQIAVTIQQNGRYFFTNDNRLKIVKRIDVLILEELIETLS